MYEGFSYRSPAKGLQGESRKLASCVHEAQSQSVDQFCDECGQHEKRVV